MSTALKYKYEIHLPKNYILSLRQLLEIDKWCNDHFGKINGNWAFGKNYEWLFVDDKFRSCFLLRWGHLFND